MKSNFRLKIFLLLLFGKIIFAQNGFVTTVAKDTFKVSLKNKYCLSATAVVPRSIEIFINEKKLDSTQFDFNIRTNCFALSDSLEYSLTDTIVAVYKKFNISLKKSYAKKKLVVVKEPNKNTFVRKAKSLENILSNSSIFGRNMKKSGTILRGFTVGTNKDFSLNSGLRLQLAGRLSNDIELVAALTDENSPIQPEGNSERLEELDKVFIQIKSPFATAVFGDYELNNKVGEFGKINRKLQGLRGNFKFGKSAFSLAYASSRGKFNSVKFNGIDGVQGPYRLTGRNGEREIIVIAGSEKVYVDGILMKRGESNDYTIEYANAEITFTPQRLITSASRIYVDFEYTARKYKRTFLGANGTTSLFNDKLTISVNFFSEGDDEKSPIDLILSDKDKKILAAAGDDPAKAEYSGITPAKPDSNGVVKGTYTKVDTVIDGKNFSYYVYLPGAATSVYNTVFSYVGQGKGDYVKESIGNYKFVGIGQGDYLPIVRLPLPASHKGGNVLVSYSPLKNVLLNLELAGSLVDKNEFSEIDDNDNSGFARNLSLKILPTALKAGGLQLGKMSLSLRQRFVGACYSAFDRINEVEFKRDYNIENKFNANESLTEAELNYTPLKRLSLSGKYGNLKTGDLFNANRFVGGLKAEKLSGIDAAFNVDYVTKKTLQIKSNWMRQNGSIGFSIFKLTPGVNYLFENKEEYSGVDSLLSTSHKYFEVSPFLNLLNFYGITLGAKYSQRIEYFPLSGKLQKESEANLKTLTVNYSGSSHLKAKLDLTFRSKKYSAGFVSGGKTNNKTVLIRFNSRMNILKRFITGNVYYNTATERTAKLQRVFVRVPVGNGNYVYLGDLNNNGVADDFEFEQTDINGDYILTTVPTDQLYPTISLQLNTRWRLDFAKLFHGNSFFEKALDAISTETFYRVDEKSKEENLSRIYLLNMNYFLKDSTTLRGSQIFQNDFFLFRNKRDFSARYRFRQVKKLSQYSAGTERGFYRENGVRLKFRLVKEINNQTDFRFVTDNFVAPKNTNRSHEIINKEVATEFSYRPYSNVEVGFKLKAAESKDDFPEKPTIIDKNAQALRITFSFKGRGRLRIETERTELSSNSTENYIPFEITQGNSIGKNYSVRISFDYRIAANLQTTLSYWGRKRGGDKIIHNLRAEARAYF